MGSSVYLASILVIASTVLVDCHLGLNAADTRYMNGLGQFFYYAPNGNAQYSAATLDRAGSAQSNRIMPCYVDGRGDVDRHKMYTTNIVHTGNYWVRLRTKYPAPIIHAEQAVLRVLPKLINWSKTPVTAVHLFTRLSPCSKCTDKMIAFAKQFPRIIIYIGWKVLYTTDPNDPTGQQNLAYARQAFSLQDNVYFDQLAPGPGADNIQCIKTTVVDICSEKVSSKDSKVLQVLGHWKLDHAYKTKN